MELLKATYRLDADAHPELHRQLSEAKARLRLDIPVTVYQAQNNPQPNAALYFIPGEGHIVFSGPVLTLLDAEELRSILGHELAHYQSMATGRGANSMWQIACLKAVALDSAGFTRATIQSCAAIPALHRGFCRPRFPFCDRRHVPVVVAGLAKVQTGLPQVSGASYLKQAEEIFEGPKVTTEELSHPEAFIRARALALWEGSPTGAATHICEMIEGYKRAGRIGLLGQQRLTQATRQLLEQLLRPKWFQTPFDARSGETLLRRFSAGRHESLRTAGRLEVLGRPDSRVSLLRPSGFCDRGPWP